MYSAQKNSNLSLKQPLASEQRPDVYKAWKSSSCSLIHMILAVPCLGAAVYKKKKGFGRLLILMIYAAPRFRAVTCYIQSASVALSLMQRRSALHKAHCASATCSLSLHTPRLRVDIYHIWKKAPQPQSLSHAVWAALPHVRAPS